MPVYGLFDHQQNILRVTALPGVDLTQDAQALQDLLENPALWSGLKILVDTRQRPMVSNDYVWEMAKEFSRLKTGRKLGPMAIVVAETVSVGLANMFLSLIDASPQRARVFADVGEAEDWLELQPADPPAESSPPRVSDRGQGPSTNRSARPERSLA